MATGELPLDIEQRCQALKAAFQAAERELSALISEPKSA
jgi:hypothetical protein